MTRRVIVHSDAHLDVIDLAYYIAEDSLDAADRFVEAIDAAYRRLANMPGIGVTRDYANPKLEGMRMWPVPGFPRYLIFYQVTESELRIVRVLHGARDSARIFNPND